MKITYFIGNGFDIGLGMKTGYKDFYPYFMDMASDDNMIKKQIQEDSSNWESYEKWADLEMGLGQFTNHVLLGQVEKFIDDKVELDKLLIDYLKKESSKHKFEEENIKKMFISSIQALTKWGVENELRLVDWVYSQFKYIQVEYDVINFNYTNCMDDFFSVIKSKVNNFSIRSQADGNAYTYKLNQVFHIHGKLNDAEMILGVNDESQIANSEIRDHEEIKRYMIKSELNEIIGQNKVKKARDIVDESNIICLYGMSLGDTDKMWWEYLANWLKNSGQRLLIIFDYAPDFTAEHARDIYRYKERVRSKFINQAGLIGIEQKELDSIKRRILIKSNENIFEYKHEQN